MIDIEESAKKLSPIFQSPTQSLPSTQNSTPQQMNASDEIPNNVFTFNKEIMRCKKADHELARLKFLCTDSQCKCEIKLACAECILNDHNDHKYVVLEKFVGDVSEKFVKLSKQAKGLEQDGQMDDFQKSLNEEVHEEFNEIKSLVLQSFEEFEKDYLANIQKFFESNRPRIDYREKFQLIVALAQSRFENMDSTSVMKVIEFFQDDKLEKIIEESEKSLLKTKSAISKKKIKYFEKFRQIVKDILIDCKTTPIKESSNLSQSPIVASGQTQNEDKKKRRITFNEESSQIYEVPQIMKPQQNISELQSFSTRSFAGETRRFSSSVYKKLKTEQQQQQQQMISSQLQTPQIVPQ